MSFVKGTYIGILLISVMCMTSAVFEPSFAHDADQQKKIIRVGGQSNYPPYEFLDENNEPAGYNIDLTRAIARMTGMDVEIELGPFHEMYRKLERGEIDVLTGLAYSDRRANVLEFTPPHTLVGHSIFTRKGAPPLRSLDEWRDGTIAAALRGGIIHEIAIRKNLEKSVVLADTYRDAIQMLSSGAVDYAILATIPALYVIRDLKIDNVLITGETVEVTRYSFATKKGNVDLIGRFTSGLASLKATGEYKQIHDRWLGVLEPPGVPWTDVIRLIIVGTLVSLSAVAVFFVWTRTLKRKVSEKTAILAQEIKERERVEDALRRNQEQLVQASKMTALGTLVSGVAHEINNPNGLILMNVPLVNNIVKDFIPILDEHYQKHGDFIAGGLRYSNIRTQLPTICSQVVDASQRIRRIVEDLKDFGRKDSAMVKEPIDLNACVNAAIRLVEPIIRKSTDRFSLALVELPVFYGNAHHITQVIVNLLLNACQSLQDRAKAVTVETRYDKDSKQIVLMVKDEGVGIPEEDLPNVSDPFFTTKRALGGTGLGLSVSAGIIKEHSGVLKIDSVVGQGTAVTVSFPLTKQRGG